MKLRRAMAVAAATAVIAPAAFFSAPAAFATGEENATTTESPSPSASSPAPEESESDPAPSDGTTEPGEETTEPGGEATEPTDGATEPTGGATSPTDGAPSPSAPSTESSAPTEPSGKPSAPEECQDEDEDYFDSALELGISGLPGKIVAGSGWHPFTLRATNTSDKALGRIDWALFVVNETESMKDKDQLGTYTTIQFQDKNGKWLEATQDIMSGVYIGDTTLKAKSYVDLKLRLNIGAKAPTDDSYAVGIAWYTDSDTDCEFSSFTDWTFEVLPAGQSNETPGKPTPGSTTKPSDTKPQGGANPLPVTGSLAETGSSSMMPVIGTVGGIAVLAGAGVMFAMKRRRDGDATA
ncbi:LAETG motif-containing sortase-dependent surface protein [Streptomyces sp. NPDC091212]|uniref:LAETG motif-containing sortase-dependent surface protein n=1 Tax=Streptomyces sp. NPDC091212 TaxID=3155191 RepID=UPI00341761E7